MPKTLLINVYQVRRPFELGHPPSKGLSNTVRGTVPQSTAYLDFSSLLFLSEAQHNYKLSSTFI